MKRKWMAARTALAVCAALGWWGVLYPELTLTPDTCEVIWEETVQGDGSVLQWDADDRESAVRLYHMLLEADAGTIRFKSRMLEQIDALLERLR